MPSNEEIAAQIEQAEDEKAAADTAKAEAQKKMDKATLEGIRLAKAAVNIGKLATFESDLGALLPTMDRTNNCRQDIVNLIAQMEATRANQDREIARLEAATADPVEIVEDTENPVPT